ncbi:MAG TPA: hypothetical protein VNV38_08920 [Stellaceae bacterium]|jgi:hypothetical protein|nr:hypothetical protein [Stellaceae bacterium]
MAENGLPDDAAIITGAYTQRVHELFKIFAEAVYTGEPERDAMVRFRRGLISARRVYAAAVEAMSEVDKA